MQAVHQFKQAIRFMGINMGSLQGELNDQLLVFDKKARQVVVPIAAISWVFCSKLKTKQAGPGQPEEVRENCVVIRTLCGCAFVVVDGPSFDEIATLLELHKVA